MLFLENAVSPPHASSKKLWSLMPREQRALAAKHFFDPDAKVNGMLRNMAIAAIAKARNTREASIRKATRPQLENWLSSNVLISDEVADTVIRLYLLHTQLPMIEAFLDDLQIPHAKGLIEESFDTGAIPADQLIAAAHRLTVRFGAENSSLYLAYTAAQTGDWAETVRKIPPPSTAPLAP
jgi:hypothetical protein